MYKKILVPTDGTERSLNAVSEGAALARALNAQLFLLHVRSPIDMPHHVEGGALSRLPPEAAMDEIEAEERKVLQSAVLLAQEAGVYSDVAFVAGYSVYETIIKVAEAEHCDLIVMSSHGRRTGLAGLLLGDETWKLLTNTKIPVLTVH